MSEHYSSVLKGLMRDCERSILASFWCGQQNHDTSPGMPEMRAEVLAVAGSLEALGLVLDARRMDGPGDRTRQLAMRLRMAAGEER